MEISFSSLGFSLSLGQILQEHGIVLVQPHELGNGLSANPENLSSIGMGELISSHSSNDGFDLLVAERLKGTLLIILPAWDLFKFVSSLLLDFLSRAMFCPNPVILVIFLDLIIGKSSDHS